MIDEGEINLHAEWTDERDRRKQMAATARNHVHVMLTNALNAATATHVAMCRFPEDHAAQESLSESLSANLTTAEVARQALGDLLK